MRNTKVIDPSLKRKIKENDEKMKMLYGIEFKRSKSRKGTYSSARNKPKNRNKRNRDDSFTKAMTKTYKDNTPMTTDSKFSKTINTDRDDSAAFMSRMQKRMKFKKDKEEKKNNTIFFNTFTNVYKKMEDKKKKKTMNKNQVDNMVDRLYNNDYKHRKPRVRESEEKKNKTIDLEDEPDVDEMIERFEDDIRKREENMEIIKRKIARDEKEIYTYKPQMSEGSRKYNDQNEMDFFERQKNFLEKKAEKEKSIKESLKKKQEDEINENNILKKKEEEKKEKEKENKVDDSEKKAQLEKSIKKMYEWEEKRKEKIEQKKKEKSEKVETDYNYVPKINQRSVELAENNKLRQKQPNIFLRLSEEDKVLKEKKQILTDMYTPSFKPRSYVPRNMNLENLKKKTAYLPQNEVEEGEEEDEDNERKKRKRRKKHKKKSDSDEEDEDEDEEDEDEDEEGEEEEDDEEEEEEKGEGDDFDYKQDTMKYAEDDVQDALRNQLFHRNKK